jgi:peptidoglycan/LPS O-acetylase OafA/YrhL
MNTRHHELINYLFFLNNRNIAWLDGLRSIAILLVISRHVFDRPYAILYSTKEVEQNLSVLNFLVSYGWSGVSLFFLISGFLVGGRVILNIKNGTFYFYKFILRRFFRIILPAAAFLLCFYISNDIKGTSLQIVNNFFLLTNYTKDGWLPHYWTLCAEEHFYIAIPIFALASANLIRKCNLKQIGIIFIIVAIVFSTLRLISPFLFNIEPRNYYIHSHWQIDFFTIGIAIRLLSESNSNFLPSFYQSHSFKIIFLLIAGLFLATALNFHSRGELQLGAIMNPFYLVIVQTITLLLMTGLFFLSQQIIIKSILQTKVIRILAAISFSIYLTHITTLEYCIEIFRYFYSLLQSYPNICLVTFIMIGTIITIIGGLIFYIIVEWPIMLLRQRIIK